MRRSPVVQRGRGVPCLAAIRPVGTRLDRLSFLSLGIGGHGRHLLERIDPVRKAAKGSSGAANLARALQTGGSAAIAAAARPAALICMGIR
jgi:hypothetical protein